MHKILKLLLTFCFIKFHTIIQQNCPSITITLSKEDFILKKLNEINERNILKNSYQNEINTNIISNDQIVKENSNKVEILNANKVSLEFLQTRYPNIKINFVISCYFEYMANNNKSMSNNNLQEINLKYIYRNREIFSIKVDKNSQNQSNFDLEASFHQPSFLDKTTKEFEEMKYYLLAYIKFISSSKSFNEVSSEESERHPLLDKSDSKKNK